MSRKVLKHDVLSDLSVGSSQLQTIKQVDPRKRDETNITQRWTSKTPRQIHFFICDFSSFRQKWKPAAQQLFLYVMKSRGHQSQKAMPPQDVSIPSVWSLSWVTEKVVGMTVTCPYAQKLRTIQQFLFQYRSSEPWFQQVEEMPQGFFAR